MLALLFLLTTSQRDILAWRAPHPVMPTHQRSLRYQYPQLPHIATLKAGRQVQGWVCHCVCIHPPYWIISLSPFLLNALALEPIIRQSAIVALFGPTPVCPHVAFVLGVFTSCTTSRYTAPAWFHMRMKFKSQRAMGKRRDKPYPPIHSAISCPDL